MTRDFERRCASIREVARDLLGREGIGSFTMERVADEAGYARSAIYRFFPSKRELLVELAVESLEVRLDLYRRAAAFDGKSRERLVAYGEVTCLLYPRLVMPQVFGQAKSASTRKTDARVEHLRELEREDDGLVSSWSRMRSRAATSSSMPGCRSRRSSSPCALSRRASSSGSACCRRREESPIRAPCCGAPEDACSTVSVGGRCLTNGTTARRCRAFTARFSRRRCSRRWV